MNNYYVYSHIQEGVTVYIGKGKDGRAWHPLRHHTDHTQWATESIHNSSWGNNVKILSSNHTSDEAYEIEKRLINEQSPKYNIEHIPVECPHCGFTAKSPGGLSSHMRNIHQE